MAVIFGGEPIDKVMKMGKFSIMLNASYERKSILDGRIFGFCTERSLALKAH